MTSERDLLRFVEGDCSPDDAAAVQAWIAADRQRGELLDELRAVWRLTGETTRRWDVATAWERLRRARPNAATLRVESRRLARERAAVARPLRWPARVAAVLALGLAGAVMWHLGRSHAPPREYATARGERAALSLRDGSRVWLGVDSRLRLSPDYGSRERIVDLEGEAYFVVRRDPEHPFLVRTPYGTTWDLGTEFGVRAYREERSLQVVVAEGRVALRGPAPSGAVVATLRPRDRAVIDSTGQATITSHVAVENYLAWTQGTLRFDDATLASVIAQLERWYDLDIRTGDASLADARLTISFTSESADEALSALAKVLDLRWTRAGTLVRLIPVHSRQ